MKALVVYESMYGNTHVVAERIAAGLRGHFDVTVVPVADAPSRVDGFDLVVVGGPTHVHTMTSERTRKMARDAVNAPKKPTDLVLDAAAGGPGLRWWLTQMPDDLDVAAAAFDTRISGPGWLTGRASKAIGKLLRSRGASLVAPPASFLVDKGSHLVEGESDRAAAWGAGLTAGTVTPRSMTVA